MRVKRTFIVMLFVALLAPAVALAQGYPQRPIKLIVPTFAELLNRNALGPTGGSPQQFEAKIASELIRWRAMVREAGLKAQ